MIRHSIRTLLTAAALALAVCALPGEARAETEVSSGRLGDFIGTDVAFTITGNVTGCDIPANVTVTVSGGSLLMEGCTNAGALIAGGGTVTGDFFNTGTVIGGGRCSGTIYNTGSADGGNVRVPGPAISGVSSVIYADNAQEDADYKGGTLWIPNGKSVRYLIIGGYICTPEGARQSFGITYLYNNHSQSVMRLDTKKYPATYYLMEADQTIPAAPDSEVGYAFSGWYCSALGYDESHLQKSLIIPGGTKGNLTLVSWWAESPGRNEGKSGSTTGMASGGGMAGSGASTGGASGTGSAGTGLLADASGETEDSGSESAVTNVLTETTNMRVRTASATTRHTFAHTDGDVMARASARQQKRFPWQWAGIIAGGALILFAAGWTIRRKYRERNEATLQKLNIRD